MHHASIPRQAGRRSPEVGIGLRLTTPCPARQLAFWKPWCSVFIVGVAGNQLRTCGRGSHRFYPYWASRSSAKRFDVLTISPAILDLPPVCDLRHRPPGSINAALFAATIISKQDSDVWKKLRQMRKEQVERVRAMKI